MKTQTRDQRIAELKATDDALVGTDEGTHGKPSTWRLYESIDGRKYAVKSFANSTGSTYSWEHAEQHTEGRIRMFPIAQSELAAARRELNELVKQRG